MIKFVLENFDTIFRNEKSLESLNKIILDLAIRGKLVEQNPEDEPASELLKRIKEEKERLIKEKVIKKEKELPKMEEDEIPFEIPESWEWVRLGEICEINMGQSPKGESVNFSDGVGLIGGASDMGEIFPKIKRYTTSPTKLCKKDDLILSVRATLGRPIFSDGIYCLGRGVCGISSSVINKKFLRNYFFSMEKELYSKANGTTFLQVTREDIVTLFFPLPPLAEQKRIVEKVERLQELIKNLKEVYLSNEKSRLNLKKSLLVEIEKSNSDKELLKNLELVFSNFDKVIRSKEDIKDIRNLILSLAIKGKLVEQNSEDEPSSELLKRIKEEKERLAKEKVIKKEKELPKIEEDEIPFEIPKSWEWVRLKEVLDVRDGTHDTPKYVTKGIPLITSKNIFNGELNFENLNYITEEEHKRISLRSKVEKGDILFAMIGSIGNPVIVNVDREFSIKNVALFKYYLKNVIKEKFLLIFLKLAQNDMLNKASGGVQKFVSLNFLRNYLFTLPPLAEQQRIVERVEKLMSICDMLEEKIVESERVSEKLLESLVR